MFHRIRKQKFIQNSQPEQMKHTPRDNTLFFLTIISTQLSKTFR